MISEIPISQDPVVGFADAPMSSPAAPISFSALVGTPFAESITFSDLDMENVTITRVGAAPAWMTENRDVTGATGYATPVTLALGGTPPTAAGTPWSFRYDVSDGVATTQVAVTLSIAEIQAGADADSFLHLLGINLS